MRDAVVGNLVAIALLLGATLIPVGVATKVDEAFSQVSAVTEAKLRPIGKAHVQQEAPQDRTMHFENHAADHSDETASAASENLTVFSMVDRKWNLLSPTFSKSAAANRPDRPPKLTVTV